MKYILYPVLTISYVVFIVFIYAPLKFSWHLFWHFEVISLKHALSFKDEIGNRRYYLPHYGFKEFMKQLFIYHHKDEEYD